MKASILKTMVYFYDMSFGKKIKELRKEQALSQTELADRLGITQKVVSDYETDRTSPPKRLLPEFAKFFGISVDELLDVEPGSESNGKTLHGNKRSAKVSEMFDQLNEEEQRVILRQIKALIEGKKHHLL
jgi:transcriptional regulator with XRE-family HTH domain